MLFDNGNTRCLDVEKCHSRGQVFMLDEPGRKVSPMLNADLGNYSPQLGAGQRLPNGNFVFNSGAQGEVPGLFGQSIELLPDGTSTYVLEVAAQDYRSYRMSDLYRGIRP